MNRKGFEALLPAVTILLISAMLLGAGLMVMDKMAEASLAKLTAITIVNESALGAVNSGAGQTFAGKYRDAVCSSFTCYNQTGASPTVAAANYTVTNCNVKWSGGAETPTFNNTIWKCSYSATWSADTYASNGTSLAASATYDIANTWLPIIIVVIVSALIIMYMMGMFGRKVK